jgi:hypothetical protein
VVSTGAQTPGLFGFQHPETTPSSIPTTLRTAPGKELGEVRKIVSFVVFGSPDAQAKEALAALNPVYESPIDGFIR